MDKGYSRKQETQADVDGTHTLVRAGYNPRAMVSMLQKMDKQLKPGGKDFTKTHPKPSDRIKDVEPIAGKASAWSPSPARQSRFDAALASARAK